MVLYDWLSSEWVTKQHAAQACVSDSFQIEPPISLYVQVAIRTSQAFPLIEYHVSLRDP